MARHARPIDAMDLRAFGEHGDKPPHAHLDRFLHHVIQARMFQRRETIIDVGAALLRARLPDDEEIGPALCHVSQFRQPFAVRVR